MIGVPAASYPVGRSLRTRRILWAVWASGALCSLLAAWRCAGFGWQTGLMVFAVVVAAGLLRKHLGASEAPSVLEFNGREWTLSGKAKRRIAQVAVALDLQFAMLLRLKLLQGTPRWIWVDRNLSARHWGDLRRALYSRPVARSGAGHPDPLR
ncbi:MAG: hypothetical protein KKC85_09565 [Gammaproteobacteria bacterium]|nr:hypothetical protein [Gammaproteobacteria bacterium]MBU1441845.1 hypothetical protein [Gammaproteobacteria bacterium]MBU2286670.1 hypothetical protein [Gammaproteobacteria bacterium]